MKITSCLVIGIILSMLSIDLNAQTNDTIGAFMVEIDTYLLDANKNISNLRISHSGTGRKIRMSGTFDNKSKLVIHKINFNGDGVKEERILITYVGDSKSVLLKMLIINDKICYAKKMKYTSTHQVITKEEIIDEKIYSKVDYTQKPAKWIYVWTFKKK